MEGNFGACKEIVEAVAGSFQLEAGLGYGLGISKQVGSAKINATAYQDFLTVGYKNGQSYTAIKGEIGTSKNPLKFSIMLMNFLEFLVVEVPK